MEEFLTAVTTDVDAYWTKVFEASGLTTPKVTYDWIPAGQTVASACGDENGTLGDSAAAYCPGDDTIYISQKFMTEIYDGSLDRALPAARRVTGGRSATSPSPTSSRTSTATRSRTSSFLFHTYGDRVPTMAFELQADCFAGTWANSAYQENRLEDGDLQEALDAVLAVGDFNANDLGHHGTPEQGMRRRGRTGSPPGDPGPRATGTSSRRRPAPSAARITGVRGAPSAQASVDARATSTGAMTSRSVACGPSAPIASEQESSVARARRPRPSR